MKKTDYEHWKDGEKVRKVPWVIKHFKSVTDVNQYRIGKKAYDINIVIMTIISFSCGIWMGNILWG